MQNVSTKSRPDRPTLGDVASRAGVSVTTVSYVLNKSQRGFIGKASRERVLKAARELGYRPNILARGLRKQTTKSIGLITRSFPNDYVTGLVRAIYSRFNAAGYSVLLELNDDSSPKAQQRALDTLLERMVDGLFVFWPARPWHFDGEEMFSPIVLVDTPEAINTPKSVAIIDVDRHAGIYEATSYLIARGRKSISLVVDARKDQITYDKVAAWRTAHEQAGLAVNDAQLIYLPDSEQWSLHHGRELGEKWLQQGALPVDAVIATHDLLAMGMEQMFLSHSVRVPEDVALVGYLGSIATEAMPVPIASIKFPIDQIADAAFGQMLGLIEKQTGTADEADRYRRLKTYFEPGASTG